MNCNTCKKESVDTFTCNNCWEVEHRLEEYLRSREGRKYAYTLLEKYCYPEYPELTRVEQ